MKAHDRKSESRSIQVPEECQWLLAYRFCCCTSQGRGDEAPAGPSWRTRRDGKRKWWLILKGEAHTSGPQQGAACPEFRGPSLLTFQAQQGPHSWHTALCLSADPVSTPLILCLHFPLSFVLSGHNTASTWEDVNLDLGGWLGWELKGSTVQPKSVVSTLWY